MISSHSNKTTFLVRLPSNKIISAQGACLAQVGSSSNEIKRYETIGNAGTNRRLGRRPKVRGVAINPIDHPIGGGEGKSSGGRVSVTPWGWHTKGRRTVRLLGKLRSGYRGWL
jgi:large subunit ribosomal protein L2